MASKTSKKKSASKKKSVKKKTATKKKSATKKTAKKAVAKKAAVKAAPKKAAPKKRKRKSSKDKKPHYVDSKVFYEQIKEYYRTDIIPDELASSLTKIAQGLSFAPNFINYSYKDEMVGDAILKMFSALKNKKFNIESHNNPFSYFTTIAFHAFINRIKKEKKYKETVTKYQETVYFDTIQDDEMSGGKHIYIDPALGDDDYDQ